MTEIVHAYDSGVFCARIFDTNTGVLLTPEEIESISYTAYLVTTRSLMSGTVVRTAISGHENITVEKTETILEEAINDNYWSVDEVGYNFIHVPDTRSNPMFSDSGNYEVLYTIQLVEGNPIVLTFEVTVQ